MKKTFHVLLFVLLGIFVIGSLNLGNEVYAVGDDPVPVEYTFTLNVTVPDNTPTDVNNAFVNVAGTLNSWTPGLEEWTLTKDSENDYLYSITKTVSLTSPTVNFKFLLGAKWDFEEVQADGSGLAADRSMTLTTTPADNVFSFTVEKWKGIPTDAVADQIGTVIVHYQNWAADYSDSGFYTWSQGSLIDFSSGPKLPNSTDDFGAVWEIPIGSDAGNQMGFIVLRNGMADGTQWDHKEWSGDIFVPLTSMKNNYDENGTQTTLNLYYFQGSERFFVAKDDMVNVLISYYDAAGSYDANLGVWAWNGWTGAYGTDWDGTCTDWTSPSKIFKDGLASEANIFGKVAMMYLDPDSVADAGFLIYAGSNESKVTGDIKEFGNNVAGDVVPIFVTGGTVYRGEGAAADFANSAFTFGFVPFILGEELKGTFAPTPGVIFARMLLTVPTIHNVLDENGDPVMKTITKSDNTTEEVNVTTPYTKEEMLSRFKVYLASEVDGELVAGEELVLKQVDYDTTAGVLSVTDFVLQLDETENLLDNANRYIITYYHDKNDFTGKEYDANLIDEATYEVMTDKEAPNIEFIDATRLVKIYQGEAWDPALFPQVRITDDRDIVIDEIYAYVKPNEGEANTGVVGDYEVTLTVNDAWGNEAQVSFTVSVLEAESSCSSATALYFMNMIAAASMVAFIFRKRNA